MGFEKFSYRRGCQARRSVLFSLLPLQSKGDIGHAVPENLAIHGQEAIYVVIIRKDNSRVNLNVIGLSTSHK